MQGCPDADVRVIRVMGGDGVVAESNLLQLITCSLCSRRPRSLLPPPVTRTQERRSSTYCRSRSGTTTSSPKTPATTRCCSLRCSVSDEPGVTVVVAAGNDSTDRPMFPAAFTPWAGGPVRTARAACLPVISVGARNPNGTIALFSNGGDWITCYRRGASLVSTYPATVNGSLQPSVRIGSGTPLPDGSANPGTRESLDGDDFRGGFAIWSGTSFAGPVLAGEIAARLLEAEKAAEVPHDRDRRLPVAAEAGPR